MLSRTDLKPQVVCTPLIKLQYPENSAFMTPLPLGDDLKGLGYRAVAVSPGRGDVGVTGVTYTGLAVAG